MRDIEEWSLQHFGSTQYMADIYQGFERAANHPSQDQARWERSIPFHMQPVGINHFAVYHRFDDFIIIGAVFHQRMDIEAHIEQIKHMLTDDIEQMREYVEGRATD